MKNLSATIDEGKPIFKQNSEDTLSYDLLRDCDDECDKGCFEIKKYVPLDVIAQCSRKRCNCWYDYNLPI